MEATEPLPGYRQIFRLWSPLLATWLMMAIEGPFLAAVIARLPGARIGLAAYGVAYAFGLVAESPIIMLMSAATALARDALAYRRLRLFSQCLNAGITLALLLLVLPPVFAVVGEGLIGLTPEVASQTHLALLLLLPWPAAIGFRRFYQGVLIRHRRTRRVAAATVFRVLAMSLTALALATLSRLPGACVGTLALSAGVSAEALMTRYLARQAVAATLATAPDDAAAVPGYGAIGRFYLPLALTPFISLSVQPLVTFFLGRGRAPVESLAVMPVLYALTFLFRAVGLSYQEVALALLGKHPGAYRTVRNVAWLLGGGVLLVLALIAFTPLAGLWFGTVSGLSAALSAFATRPLQILCLLPPLTVLLSFQRAVLMAAGTTTPISLATGLEALAIFALLGGLILQGSLAGIVAAACAYLFGRLLAVTSLAPSFIRARRTLATLPLPVASSKEQHA
jgi:progressive ankylosis protein